MHACNAFPKVIKSLEKNFRNVAFIITKFINSYVVGYNYTTNDIIISGRSR